MDADTVRKIADALYSHVYHDVIPALLLQIVLIGVAAAIGAYFGEYLKTKGKNLATKQDFDDLKSTLAAQTELVERIKSDVAQKDWVAREWANLRRVKLEELLTKMHDCEDFLTRYRNRCFDGLINNERDPVGEFETIAALYFTELREQTYAYAAMHRKEITLGSNMMVSISKAEPAEHQRIYETYHGQVDLKGRVEARIDLNSAASDLVKKIVQPSNNA